MRKLIDIAINDLRVTFKDNSVWLNLLVIPVVLIFFIGLANGAFADGDDRPRIRIDLIDNDDSTLSEQFVEDLRTVNDTLLICPMDDNDEDICRLDDEPLTQDRAAERVREQVTTAYVLIPEDFAASVRAGEEATIVYRSEEDVNQVSPVQQSVQAVAQRIGSAAVASRVGVDVFDEEFGFADEEDRETFSETVYQRADDLLESTPALVSYSETVSDEPNPNLGLGFRQSVPGMGSMYVMFTVLAGAVILLQERQNWTLQRLVMMPVSRAQLLGGKVLARFLMGLIQFAVAFAAGYFFGLRYDNIPALLLIMIAYTACITALMILLATFVTREAQASGLVTFLALTLAPLGGAWWPLEVAPQFMQNIGMLTPVGWAMDGFTELLFYDGTLVDILPHVGVLLAAAAVLFTVAVFRFRYE